MAVHQTHIGTDRQLFVDDYWIADYRGTARKLHNPVRREAAISIDKPWEQGSIGCMTTIQDKGVFRAWYRCDHQKPEHAGNPRFTAYAESVDGIHWHKPALGHLRFRGSRDNNLVWMGPASDLSPFLDGGPNTTETTRYKAVVRERGQMFALASLDGIRWRFLQGEPVFDDGPFDTVSVPFWDDWKGQYVFYTRGKAGTGGSFRGGVRWIRRATSKNFVDWSPLESIQTGDAQLEHLYTNAAIRYGRAPGTYLMFPSRFVPERIPDPDWPHGSGVNDIVFMSSRDGLRFDRSFMEAFIRPGTDKDNWHERGLYMEVGMLQTSKEEISFYGRERGKAPSAYFRRFALRTDGFVSLSAGYPGGEATTRPFLFAGRELELNYSTSAVGLIRVEIQDASRRPLPGFSLDDCNEKFGDEIEGVVSWKGGRDLSTIIGRPVRIRFELKDADVYAFRFRA